MKLLYTCTHNACHSLLNEAITRELAGDRIQVASAGSSPAGRIHPLTLEYLQGFGYSTEGLYSKSIEAVKPFETMGDEQLSALFNSIGGQTSGNI